MARDPRLCAVKATFLTAGPSTGRSGNQFNFQFTGAGDPLVTDWDALFDLVAAFYNAGTGTKVGQILGPQVSRNANTAELALYNLDLADPHHYYGSPVHVRPFTLVSGLSTNPLPNEVACVLSYRTQYGTDPEHGGTTRPRASDRGRIYLGPLVQDTVATATTPAGMLLPIVVAGVVTGIKTAFTTLNAASLAANWNLSVWSRKEEVFKGATYHAVNDEFDTERRRQADAGLLTWIAG